MRTESPDAAVSAVLNPLPAPPLAERILVIRLGALGDVVRTRFAFAGLRELYPGARIDWLVEDHAADGLAGIEGLDRIVRFERRALSARRPLGLQKELRSLLGRLRDARYDLSVDFHGILKSGLLAWAARIPLRAGFDSPYAREGSARFLTLRARLSGRHLSRFERNAGLVRFLGGEVPAQPPPVNVPAERSGDSFAVVHPGTSAATQYKRWSLERFAEVCAELSRLAGLRSVVTWGPVAGEREAAERVVERAHGAAVLAPPTRSTGELLGLLRGASLFLGCDSGPMHVAALAGVPIVAVFGPTDPLENAPFPGVPQRILRRDVGCNPCREGCPARTCMAAVDSRSVADAALELLGETRSPDA
ncbi:MAG: glycosyltransferase family 9 protein [Proteobacteria bacterium]|nr:glycosyltransferase family 9 protein [Pseudomonadota bacterium]